MAPTKKKTTTEGKTIDEFFSCFETEYKPFVEWFLDKETDTKFAILEFVSNEPEQYTNKWNRVQWKIEVMDDTDQLAFLSGGKRLFQSIMRFCKKESKLPQDLGLVQINRIGSGFDTRYKVDYFQK